MNPRMLNILTIIVVCGVGVLFLMNIRSVFTRQQGPSYLGQDDVRGAAIMHKKNLYTLNFDQQKQVVDLLNRAVPIQAVPDAEGHSVGNNNPEVEKIFIYLFGGSVVELQPVAWVDQSLVFSAPVWQQSGYLRDTSSGKLYDVLKNTYDN